MQSEAIVSNATKSTYQKKYKCPYCDGRFTRAKLHLHIQEKHEDLIPEGYTALRVAFNTINNKTEGHCIMCGNVTDWNEDKGRYERLCNDPKCHEAYKKMVAERTKKKYGTERLQTDPEYAEYVQRKALAGRKMHGEYTFADGGKIEYFGSYERKFLQFMDQVMHCESEDILAPAPSIKYQYEGKTHLYIPDFYYIPYNLIIEIKDGGSNPNNHPHRTGEDELKLRAKEEAIRQLNEFSYVRVVNNDFSQVLSIMAVLKYNMAHRYKDPVIKVNESSLLETASAIDKNFKHKDRIELSSLKRVHITEAIIEKYKKQYPDLRHVRCKDTDTYKCDGYMWFDNENLVAQVGSCEYLDDHTKWIVSLDIMKDYKGHGLSKQILDFATKTMKCRYLSVDKNNKLAKMIYDQYGFKVYYEDENLYYMTLEANPVKVNESALLEFVSNSNYPKKLYNWMKVNIQYKSTGILLSPKEVEANGYGDCHDQASYIHSKLSSKEISNGRLFMIEYNDLNSPAGKTHTAAYYKQNGKYYWIENAWYGQTGIHGPYNSIFDLKVAIANVWIWGNYKNLYMGSINSSKIKYGMSLNDYVNACLPEDEKKIKPFITNDKINKSSLNESILINEKDIYYNKNKFDSGEINLCFITGLSGSGKSTMGRDMQSHGIEHYELDDLLCVKEHFTMAQLKEYGDLIYSYFNGIGKKFYKTLDELQKEKIEQYETVMFPEFVHYAMDYVKKHTNKKFVIEGVWIFRYCNPEEFKDYAFYIKGTSIIISNIRASKRDCQDAENTPQKIWAFLRMMTNIQIWKWSFINEKDVNRFRDYFKNLMAKREIGESMAGAIGSVIPLTPNPIPYECDKDNYYIIQHMQNNVFNYSITKDPVQYTMYSVDPEEHGFYKVFKTDKSKISKKYTTFKIKDKQTAKELYDELAMVEAYGKKFFAGDVSRDYIYRRLTEGSRLLSDDQIKYDTRFEQVESFDEQIQDICEGVRSFILGDPITRLEEQVSNLADLNTLHEASTSSSNDVIFADDATTYVAKIKQAEEAEKNYGLVLIYPDNIVSSGKEDIDKLKAKYSQYLALNQNKRTLSNRTAYNIFGYDNDTMYSKLLSRYMNNQVGYTSDNSNMVIAPIDQYYSPTDKIDYASSDVNVSHEEVVDETSWKRVISELCVRMKNTSDSEQKKCNQE
jgi:ribosomal protein S18 acetylase RimI-like enzyme